jgi:hypothetical protein
VKPIFELIARRKALIREMDKVNDATRRKLTSEGKTDKTTEVESAVDQQQVRKDEHASRGKH